MDAEKVNKEKARKKLPRKEIVEIIKWAAPTSQSERIFAGGSLSEWRFNVRRTLILDVLGKLLHQDKTSILIALYLEWDQSLDT